MPAATPFPGMKNPAGRVAMVTGGTRGIGAAISQSLAGQGAAIAACYETHREHAEAFQSELARASSAISIHHGDVGSPEDCGRIVDEVFEHHGNFGVMLEERSVEERGKFHYYMAKLYAKGGRNELALQYRLNASRE